MSLTPHAFVAAGSVVDGCDHCPLPMNHPIHGVLADEPLPVTPYDDGTSSGHSGSEASQERSERRDSDGSTSRMQGLVLASARQRGHAGITVAELRDFHTDDHHGTISGALSNLHQSGALARLKDKRNRCSIYVLPDWVSGRETVAHGHRKSRLTADDYALLGQAQRQRDQWLPGSATYQLLDGLVDLVTRLNSGTPTREDPA